MNDTDRKTRTETQYRMDELGRLEMEDAQRRAELVMAAVALGEARSDASLCARILAMVEAEKLEAAKAMELMVRDGTATPYARGAVVERWQTTLRLLEAIRYIADTPALEYRQDVTMRLLCPNPTGT